MKDKTIRKIVIVGGGTAGWMTAAPLAQNLGGNCEIVLVESPDIGTVGVGEATLPTLRYYNHALGLDSADFVRKTKATFKLGIEFKDWGHLGNRFFHGFGDFGPNITGRAPYLYWLRMAREFKDMPSYENWSMATMLARSNRFIPPYGDPQSVTNAFSYAFHFDAGLYAAYLRDYAMQRGVTRIEGMITGVEQHPETGFITAVALRDGRRVEGDLFVDCSGFRGLLIEGVYKAGYDDWSAMLPCNSAQAVPCAKAGPLTPYTTSTARSAGWTWRIPLQHRTGNGHVYCDGFTTDEEASRVLLEGLDGSALDQPRQLRFTTGRRRRSWVKNCVAIGLSSGFLEPLESTSINIIENAVGWLIQFFPDRDFRPELADEFNRLVSSRYEYVRDFIILHYKVTKRSDSEFWRYCAGMSIPDTLHHQIELFRETGHVALHDKEGFSVNSHVSILMGLGIVPKRYDPFVDMMDLRQLQVHFHKMRETIQRAAAAMPDHGDYIQHHVIAPAAADLHTNPRMSA
ncbi:tryptophan halogenase family protein [Massilia endophytica]|uniref:tryptophan halogenase family protein n=1 Tax=Massilia endophytica TaxID=2899220 RepID=UPI001E611AF2|nr:tryptophan halogenase family protein [Massilia endophytica]UGQ44548.1 tryptophan 7-halogenase [Massilia endophytica]